MFSKSFLSHHIIIPDCNHVAWIVVKLWAKFKWAVAPPRISENDGFLVICEHVPPKLPIQAIMDFISLNFFYEISRFFSPVWLILCDAYDHDLVDTKPWRGTRGKIELQGQSRKATTICRWKIKTKRENSIQTRVTTRPKIMKGIEAGINMPLNKI